jgi:hypothetical protein
VVSPPPPIRRCPAQSRIRPVTCGMSMSTAKASALGLRLESVVLRAQGDRMCAGYGCGDWRRDVSARPRRPAERAGIQPGRYPLATGGNDRIARVWIVDHGLLIKQPEERLIRNLHPDEWRRYFRGEPTRRRGPTCSGKLGHIQFLDRRAGSLPGNSSSGLRDHPRNPL